jgi:holo-[acyl-carrier protein] synthase
MIKGLGVDIIEIDRVKEAVERHGEKFLNRVFTGKELDYCTHRRSFRFPELAVRFAAKEAYSKALGTGISGIKFREIEVVNDKKGKPSIAVKGKINKKVFISLSHSLNYAVATVVIEK